MKVFDTAGVGWKTGETKGESLHLKFAMLQFKMADANKTQALKEMKTIEDDQAEQKKITDIMQKLRNAKTGNPDDTVNVDEDTAKYLDKNNIRPVTPQVNNEKIRKIHEELEKKAQESREKGVPVEINTDVVRNYEKIYRMDYNNSVLQELRLPGLKEGKKYSAAELEDILKKIKPVFDLKDTYKVKDMDSLIQSLQSRLDTVGTATQQIMVKTQDSMGKYNSYLGGAGSAVQQGNQLLGDMARMR